MRQAGDIIYTAMILPRDLILDLKTPTMQHILD
jgi:hypothetical protein